MFSVILRVIVLMLAALAGLPLLVFAVFLFEPSSPERFLPGLPFLLFAMAAGWNETQFAAADAGHQGFLTQASFDAYHLLNKSDGAKKGKEGSCSADKKGKEGSCSGH